MEFITILKMSLAAAFYILVTWVTQKLWNRGKNGTGARILVGLVFGGCSVLSTHIGVDYGRMMLNVRDIGPLAAGLFFHPVSGVIAGLIGGVERYIAGTFWHIGEYTRLACSVSTTLAGLLPVVLHFKMHNSTRPPVFFSFFLGALMEVFHMYAVFITHRTDIRTAYEVVRVCAPPMILFTGLGLVGCSLAARVASGEGASPELRLAARKALPRQFQFWLMMGTALIFLINYVISYSIATQNAKENAAYKLEDWSADVKNAYETSMNNSDRMSSYVRKEFLKDTNVILKGMENADVLSSITAERLDRIRSVAGFQGLYLLDAEGAAVLEAGEPFPALENTIQHDDYVPFADLLAGKAESTLLTDGLKIYAVFRYGSGYLCSSTNLMDRWDELSFMDMATILNNYQLPENSYYQIIFESSEVTVPLYNTIPSDQTGTLPAEMVSELASHHDGAIFFSDRLYGPGFYMYRPMDGKAPVYSLIYYPASEAFEDRDAQNYETAFSDILIFVGLYLIITALMNRIVVNPLGSVNTSLQKITAGELNEIVNVRSATEFELLSDDINKTVDALKGYIRAAEKRMEQELMLARTIQDSALPRNFTFSRKDFELYATMDPAKEVGGDFYDFFFTGPGRLAMVIADVSGKGIPGALFMMQAKAAIRNQAETGISPSEIFTKANHVLCEGNEAEMFVTAWIGIINLETGKMTCSNAGHEYPVICRAGGEYELFRDKHTLALAAVDGFPMKEYELELHPGDRLFVYTDGIPEAVNSRLEAYGPDRMVTALNRAKTGSQKQALQAVREDLSAFVGEADQFDDITMLGFAYLGPQPRG